MEMIKSLSGFLPGIPAGDSCCRKLVRTLWMMAWGRGPEETLPSVRPIWFLPESRLRRNRARVWLPARRAWEARGPATSARTFGPGSRSQKPERSSARRFSPRCPVRRAGFSLCPCRTEQINVFLVNNHASGGSVLLAKRAPRGFLFCFLKTVILCRASFERMTFLRAGGDDLRPPPLLLLPNL